MTVRKNIKKPEPERVIVDSMIRPVKNYKAISGTQQEREGVHLLFENYQSRTEDNLKKRLAVLKWPDNMLDLLESKGFIQKAEFSKKVGQLHYMRLLFRKPERKKH